jgi:cupin 2 domain-containing protein
MIEGQVEPIEMRPGDSVLLPAHCRHRVSWTDPDQVTIWLALHFPAAGG